MDPVTGIERIAAERQRQLDVEGWTAEHDAEYIDGELSGAAAAYVIQARNQIAMGYDLLDSPPPSNTWRWATEWWKPSADPVRNLEKAGALIAAEIDRILAERAEAQP